MPLTKIDIIDSLYTELDIPKKECAAIVESLFAIVKEELAKGEKVMISGFGRWSVREKRARRGRNPRTGEAMTITARKVVTFKPSTALRIKH